MNWQKGDEKNALIVLTFLKKYVAGDVKGATENFADTCEFIADQFHFKGKRDSLVTILSGIRGDMTSLTKEFDTWITTYYPEKKDTYVTYGTLKNGRIKKAKKIRCFILMMYC